MGTIARRRSKLVVGFHRLGIALGAPFLLIAAALALYQWQYPTGDVAVKLPIGAKAWNFGDEANAPAKQIIARQRAAGFDLPAGFMLVGIPLGATRNGQVDLTKYQLVDGREIEIASSDANKVDEIARTFMLTEATNGRLFTREDKIVFDGVPVTFFGFFGDLPSATSPWLAKQRDWTWALLALCFGVAIYVAARAMAGSSTVLRAMKSKHPASPIDVRPNWKEQRQREPDQKQWR